MYLRRSCDVGLRRCKKSLVANWLQRTLCSADGIKSVRCNNRSSTLSNTTHSDYLDYPRKPNSFVLSVSAMQFWVYRAFHNNEGLRTSKKSTQIEEGNKMLKPGDNTEKKPTNTEKKVKFKQKLKTKKSYSFVKTHKYKITALLFGIASVFYVMHLVADPITGRKKFHLFSESEIRVLGNMQSEYYQKKYKDKIETSGTHHSRVSKVVTTLTEANSDLPGASDRSWRVVIIDRKDVVNSYVFANGDVFVFTGLVEAVGSDGDDHLAAVFAHQISHVLLNHPAETPTLKRLFLAMLLYPLLKIHDRFPRLVGFIIVPILRQLGVIKMKRPMGKKLEREADRLSVEIVAKACYDPRKVKEFWTAVDTSGRLRRPKLLRLHPNDKARGRDLDSLMPKAFNILNKRCAGSSHPFFR